MKLPFVVQSLLVSILGTLIYHRKLLLSGFDMIPGSKVDTRFNTVILEHWYRYFQGLESWNTPNFFYPLKGVLGYSDSWFIASVPYSGLRLAGFDQYASLMILLMAMSVVGGLFASLFLKRIMNFTRPIALGGGLCFVLFHTHYRSMIGDHPQLHAALLTPLLLYCLLSYLFNKEKNSPKGWIQVLLFAFLLGAICYSWFYTGWFLCLFLGVSAAIYCLHETLIRRRPSLVPVKGVLAYWKPLLASVAVLSVFAGLLLATYYPALRATGGRDYESVLYYLPSTRDFFNVGYYNLIWGSLCETFIKPQVASYSTVEFQYGIPFLTLALFFGGLAILSRKAIKARGNFKSDLDDVVMAFGAAIIFLWVLMIKIDGKSLWYLVYHWVPGSQSIRGVFRINIVLSFPILVVALFAVSRIIYGTKIHRAFGYLLVFGMAIEQLNTSPTGVLSREDEIALIENSVLSYPVDRAEAFFISSSEKPQFGPVERQIDAMIIAQANDIPTVNGYTGFDLANWHLGDVNAEAYESLVFEWLELNGEEIELLSYDIGTSEWRLAESDE